MEIKIIKTPISKQQLVEIAEGQFGELTKAVIDIEQEIMAVGGELHSDAEIELAEKENSKREYTWGVNLWPKRPKEAWIEFDSVINIKPSFGNRSRDVEDPETKAKVKSVINKLINK